MLADLLRSYGSSGRTIVFTETKNDANELATSLATVAEARPLHGDIPQSQREVPQLTTASTITSERAAHAYHDDR